jgi:hypothetical protein
VGQLATTAALVGVEVLWHHQIREHQARVRESALGIAPLNDVHAGMKHATGILASMSQQPPQPQVSLAPLKPPTAGSPAPPNRSFIREGLPSSLRGTRQLGSEA